MFVITADQHASQRVGDRVDRILSALRSELDAGEFLRPFQRTAGDEIQGVPRDASACLRAALALQRHREWAVGIGVGPARLGEDSRSSTGPAFVRARAAVERASSKAVAVPLALEADADDRSHETQGLLMVIASLVRRRSASGWEAVDLLRSGTTTYRAVADRLGISPQAVSKRLRAAMWAEEQAVHPLAVRLLGELEQAPA